MGKVYLVGAGPYDKELITVKGKRLIQEADVIVYDYLANNALLEDKREGCETIYVGKSSGNHTMSQEEINQLLVELAGKHDAVVRLKGGDPYVFGRGGEECSELHDKGIEFEVVPGITSTIGGLTYAGIPITSRGGVATSFHVLTGHFKDDSVERDFESLAKLNGTLVFVMGVKNLSKIVNGLTSAGKAIDTPPIAIIYKASSPDQSTVQGTLGNIMALAEKENVKPPSLIVIGDVVKEREVLDFYSKQPMLGKHILVTRSRKNHSKFTDSLTRLGAKVTQIPTIKTVGIGHKELKSAIANIKDYKKVIFTSGVGGVSRFFGCMAIMGYDNRHLGGVEVVAVGIETGKILKKNGINADYIPKTFSNDGIVALLNIVADKGEKMLLPRSLKGSESFVSQLNELYEIKDVPCYDTVSVTSEDEISKTDEVKSKCTSLVRKNELDLSADYLTFTSSSTVKGFVDRFGSDLLKSYQGKIVAIGPKTKETIRSYGAKESLMPTEYTIAAMTECIKEDIL